VPQSSELEERDPIVGVRDGSLLKRLACVAAGVSLTWLILTKTLVAYLAQAAPEWALRIDPGEPFALTMRADRMLNESDAGGAKAKPAHEGEPGGDEMADGLARSLAKIAAKGLQGSDAQSDADSAAAEGPLREKTAEAAALASRALQRAPINSRAVRILGQTAQAEGNRDRAEQLMGLAARLSQRESYAVNWLMLRAYEKKDYAAALERADILLRTRTTGTPYAVPVLARLAETKEANAAVKDLIGSHPPWRPQFFDNLYATITDARTPLDLMLALKEGVQPPTTRELSQYLNFLISKKLYDLAYYAWLQFLPASELSKIGLITNASFEVEPSGLPFDWALGQGDGSLTTLVARSDKVGQHALQVEFIQGRVEFPGVVQTVMLPAARYSLRGLAEGSIVGRRGLVWQVTCEASGAVLGKSEMIMSPGAQWKPFSFDFEVPKQDCRAQRLALVLDARSASEQIVTGELRFDELSVQRLVEPQAPAPEAPGAGGGDPQASAPQPQQQP